eukprot:CAMPEP_0201869210 /NCGR_PEP_ID=MMETSP0902-20130614/2809_1 /ASSEMBLY_ACC=CAM_ASM_000551 /TAXON_ID=420261 /ORGANISM="Thalassiosira antarctica, Strain CCMP982" /LENGTH=137 /DNA_ID=CAMNT_0048394675 /DNA_START=486 /DNA_END=899 /DNA_ORIENTATION=+
MADAIFSAPTLKFIFNKNVVWVADFKDSRSVERAPDLSDLDMEEMLALDSASEYIPTEYTLIGPFFLTPTPNNGRLPRLSSNLIFVAGSIKAAAASAMGKRPRAMATIASPMAATFLGNDIGFIEAFLCSNCNRRQI